MSDTNQVAAAGVSIMSAATTSRVELAGRQARKELARWVNSAGYLAPSPVLVGDLIGWLDELLEERERVREALDEIGTHLIPPPTVGGS